LLALTRSPLSAYPLTLPTGRGCRPAANLIWPARRSSPVLCVAPPAPPVWSPLICSGVHAIVDCSVQQRSEGRRLLLAGCSERVRRIFALTGTGTEVEFVELCEAEALIGTLPTSQSVAA